MLVLFWLKNTTRQVLNQNLIVHITGSIEIGQVAADVVNREGIRVEP